MVGALLSTRKNLCVMLGDVVWNLLLHFLGFAMAIRDCGKEWIL